MERINIVPRSLYGFQMTREKNYAEKQWHADDKQKDEIFI